MSQEVLIELKNINKTFPGVKALTDVSMDIRKGEIHALAGENGAGKSTLIKILTGVYSCDEGSEMYMNGKKITLKTPSDAVQRGISVIYQDFSLFANMTVAENILFGYEMAQNTKIVNWKKRKARAIEVLKELEIDVGIDELVENLSVGKQQMVAIARALVFDAKLLIMDEPTSTLSNAEVEHLLKIVKKLRDSGLPILFITHKLDELFAVADRVTVLRDGYYINTFDTSAITKEDLVLSMVGRKVLFTKKEHKVSDDVVLKVEGLSKEGNYADISFELHRGEILGISGLVGSGRTEVIMTLFGLIKPDSGKIYHNGKLVNIKSAVEAKKMGMALVPENRLTEGIFMENTVSENIIVSALEKKFGKTAFIDKKVEKEVADKHAKMLDLRPLRIDLLAKNFSGGNQQKVVIAKWLANDPDILLIDEPTNGIDIGAKTEIHNLLTELTERGKSIIVVSSEMLEIIALCDRALIMRQGRISAELSAGEITQEAMAKASLA